MAGRMLVYLPHDPHIGISQKIDSETERTQLRERALMPEGEKAASSSAPRPKAPTTTN